MGKPSQRDTNQTFVPRTMFVGGEPDAGLEGFLRTHQRLTGSSEVLVDPEVHPVTGTRGFRVRRTDAFSPSRPQQTAAYWDAVQTLWDKHKVPRDELPIDGAVATEAKVSVKTIERWRAAGHIPKSSHRPG